MFERLGLAFENLDLAVGELGAVFEAVEEGGGILPAGVARLAQFQRDYELLALHEVDGAFPRLEALAGDAEFAQARLDGDLARRGADGNAVHLDGDGEGRDLEFAFGDADGVFHADANIGDGEIGGLGLDGDGDQTLGGGRGGDAAGVDAGLKTGGDFFRGVGQELVEDVGLGRGGGFALLDELGNLDGVGGEAGAGGAVEDLVGDAHGVGHVDRLDSVGVDGAGAGVEAGERDLQQVVGAERLRETDGGGAVGQRLVGGVGVGVGIARGDGA